MYNGTTQKNLTSWWSRKKNPSQIGKNSLIPAIPLPPDGSEKKLDKKRLYNSSKTEHKRHGKTPLQTSLQTSIIFLIF